MNYSFFFLSPAQGQRTLAAGHARLKGRRAGLACPPRSFAEGHALLQNLSARLEGGLAKLAEGPVMIAGGQATVAAGHAARKQGRAGSVKRLAAALEGFAAVAQGPAAPAQGHRSTLQGHAAEICPVSVIPENLTGYGFQQKNSTRVRSPDG